MSTRAKRARRHVTQVLWLGVLGCIIGAGMITLWLVSTRG